MPIKTKSSAFLIAAIGAVLMLSPAQAEPSPSPKASVQSKTKDSRHGPERKHIRPHAHKRAAEHTKNRLASAKIPIVPLPTPVPRIPSLEGTLQANLVSLLASPEIAGDNVGFLLLDKQGKEILARHADTRFIPASCRKILTTA
ncbi:MAG: D-alanyl-D-alanine carboxypeptidase, partial [Cyanobacteria bacterium REEB65]|nr:D-alanyl-D-alanine carboxypeptidase [Cyanobacteria bacterium REEB65]